MNVSRALVFNSLRKPVILAQLHLFEEEISLLLDYDESELPLKDISQKIPRELGFWPWLNLFS